MKTTPSLTLAAKPCSSVCSRVVQGPLVDPSGVPLGLPAVLRAPPQADLGCPVAVAMCLLPFAFQHE